MFSRTHGDSNNGGGGCGGGGLLYFPVSESMVILRQEYLARGAWGGRGCGGQEVEMRDLYGYKDSDEWSVIKGLRVCFRGVLS